MSVMQQWLFPDMLDQHGYVTPTLIEATTKPHNPGIDYDLWLKWNQPRTAANVAALAAVRARVPASDQRLVRERRPAADRIVGLPRRQPARAGGRGGLGRLGSVLHADVQPARRPQRLDGGDVLEHGLQPRDAARLRRARADDVPARPSRGPHGAVRGRHVDARVRHRASPRPAGGPARDLPPRRRGRSAAGVLPGAVRRRQQLDARVPRRRT